MSNRRRAKKEARKGVQVRQPKPEPEVQEKQELIPVTVMRDHTVQYPELYLEVWIPERSAEILFTDMLVRARCWRANSLEEADVVIFTGGPDVSPNLYGETAHPETRANLERDERDMEVFAKCYEMGIPMLGICRGAQFLHVMNGGKLFQHIDGHNEGPHTIFDVFEKDYVQNATSTHHQSCIKNDKMHLIATSSRSKKRWKNELDYQTGGGCDVEAFWYADTACLGIQGHPEFRGYPRYTEWCLKQMEAFFKENPDIQCNTEDRPGHLRLSREIIIGRTEDFGESERAK